MCPSARYVFSARIKMKSLTTRTRKNCGVMFQTGPKLTRAAAPGLARNTSARMATAIKRARHLALLPFVADHSFTPAVTSQASQSGQATQQPTP